MRGRDGAPGMAKIKGSIKILLDIDQVMKALGDVVTRLSANLPVLSKRLTPLSRRLAPWGPLPVRGLKAAISRIRTTSS